MDKPQIVKSLTELLGTSTGGLTPDNFHLFRPVIENEIFPSTASLGIDVSRIKSDYQTELIQSSDGPDRPSSGRLGYIKGHLQELLEKVEAYNP